MSDPKNPQAPGRAEREAETAETKAKEGTGAVPNVPSGPDEGASDEVKKALHEVEEEKGDWSKGH